MNAGFLSQLGRRTGAPPISWLMQWALARPKLISLAAGFTDDASLPVDEVRKVVDEVLANGAQGRRALQYGSTQGNERLRRLSAERLRQSDRSVGARTAREWGDRTIITNGSQQLLYMLVEALCDPGDIVLVEDPTYFVFLGILQSLGVRARGVRMEPDGLDLGHLDEVLQSLKTSGELNRVKALYVVPYFQNPTGITTALEKKRRALQLLRRYERRGGPICFIEDAAYRELRFAGSDVPSALGIEDAADRVIYAATYSKPFATGMRVGFGILPEPLFTTVLRIKGNHDFGTSNLLQQVVARTLESGRYESHLAQLRKRYAHKATLMARALKEHFPAAVNWTQPAGGLYFWPRLPAHTATGTGSKLFRAALRRDVLYVPGDLCYAEDDTRKKPNHEMRLSFGSATEAQIKSGVQRLGSVMQQVISS